LPTPVVATAVRKTVLNPDAGNDLVADVEGVPETAYAGGVVVSHPGHDRVHVSGVTPTETADDSVAEQTREVLETIQRLVESQGGSMDDVVRVRVFLEDAVDTDFGAVHAVRGEFFDREQFPASTLVEVDRILRGRIEIEADAVIPDDGWETTAESVD